MFLLSFGLLTLITVLFLFYKQPFSKGLPPGPKGLPLIGHLLELYKSEPIQFYKKYSDKYGPLMSIQIGLQRVIILTSAPVVVQALVKKGEIFSGRPKGGILDIIIGGKGIAMTSGETTAHARKVLRNSLKDFGYGKSGIQQYVDLELEIFMHIVKKKAGTPYDPKYDLSVCVLNIIWEMMSGERFKVGDPLVNSLINSIEASLVIVEPAGFNNFISLYQFVTTFCRPISFTAGLGLFRRLYFFGKSIANHKKNFGDMSHRKDFIYNFIVEQKKHQDVNNNKIDFQYSDTQCKWIMSDVFIAGLETTVTTLRWSFLLLAKHLEVQEKLHKEIEEVLGKDQCPLLLHKKEMPFTEAFMSEVLRMFPPLPIYVHSCSEDTELENYFIPKDSWIFINVWAIHNDSKIWGDPEVFRPERFINEEGKYERNPNCIPFSMGSKNCVGENLAIAELFLFLTNICQKFRIKGTSVDLKLKNTVAFTMLPPTEKFIFTPKS